MQSFRLTLPVALMLALGGCATSEVRNTNELPVYCLDEPDPGPCGKHVLRYFYDYRADRCRSFHYGGCQGYVPFETLDACEKTCMQGTIAEVPPDREQPRRGTEASSFSHSTLVTDAREPGNKEQPEQETEVKPFPLFTLAADVFDRLLPKQAESQ